MSNQKTAEQVIEKLANAPVSSEVLVQPEIHREAQPDIGLDAKHQDEKYETVVTITLVALGYAISFEGASEEEAHTRAVDFIKSELDSGNLILADDWDNPAPVDFTVPAQKVKS